MYAQTFHKGEWVARHTHTGPSFRHLEGRSRRIRREFRVSSAAEPIRSLFGLHVFGVVGKKNSVNKEGKLLMLTEGAYFEEIRWATDCSSVWENHLCISIINI